MKIRSWNKISSIIWYKTLLFFVYNLTGSSMRNIEEIYFNEDLSRQGHSKHYLFSSRLIEWIIKKQKGYWFWIFLFRKPRKIQLKHTTFVIFLYIFLIININGSIKLLHINKISIDFTIFSSHVDWFISNHRTYYINNIGTFCLICMY